MQESSNKATAMPVGDPKGDQVERTRDLSAADRDFIDQSAAREKKARARSRRVQALVYVLLLGIILGLIGVINENFVKGQWNWYRTMRPYRVANIDPYILKPEA